MFGFSFGELIMVVVVAVVVIGPKDMPKMLRKLGQMAGKLRRMASDLRAQSGIDEALRTEGLTEDIAEIRKLARGELDAVRQVASIDIAGPAATIASASASAYSGAPSSYDQDFMVAREREYPRDGADAMNALPEDAIVYAEGMLRSPLAKDPLYVLGDPEGVIPDEPPPPPFADFSPADEPPSPHLEAHAASGLSVARDEDLGANDLAFTDQTHDHGHAPDAERANRQAGLASQTGQDGARPESSSTDDEEARR